jgi:hypothetical protein
MATKSEQVFAEYAPSMSVHKSPSKGWIAQIDLHGALQHRMYGQTSPSIEELLSFAKDALHQGVKVDGLRQGNGAVLLTIAGYEPAKGH